MRRTDVRTLLQATQSQGVTLGKAISLFKMLWLQAIPCASPLCCSLFIHGSALGLNDPRASCPLIVEDNSK